MKYYFLKEVCFKFEKNIKFHKFVLLLKFFCYAKHTKIDKIRRGPKF